MKRSAFLSLLLAFTATVLGQPASPHAHRAFGHHDSIARRHASLNPTNSTSDLEKRGGNQFTWWEVGLGACGGYNKGSEFVVAIPAPRWDGGSHCYKSVTITWQGQTRTAQVVDECMGCSAQELDMSHALFSSFVSPDTPENVGTIFGDWSFSDGGSSKPDPTTEPVTTKEQPKTTSTPTSTPSPTPTPTTSSTPTSTPSPTTSEAKTTSTPTSTPSPTPTPSPTTDAAPPATTIAVDDPQLLNQLNMVVLGLAGLLTAAASGQE